MPRLGILEAGAPALRQPAKPVPPDLFGTEALAALIKIMIATMRRAPGVGLAAPQIGVPLRVIVLEDRPDYHGGLTAEEIAARGRRPFEAEVFVNPVLRPLSDEKATFFEGCLSVPGYEAMVTRWLNVEVQGLDAHGTPKTVRAQGWHARIFQHEVDHLDGKLYIDAMDTRSFATHRSREQQGLDEMLQSLGIGPRQ